MPKPMKDYAEFIHGERGPEGWPELTVRLIFKFKEEFKDELKAALPPGTRSWNPAGDCWQIMPQYVEEAIEIAKRHFQYVYVTEGARTTEVKSNVSHEQGGLFG